MGGGGSHNDAVEGSVFRPAGVAVPGAYGDVLVTEPFQHPRCATGQLLDNLDAVDMPYQAGENCCLIA